MRVLSELIPIHLYLSLIKPPMLGFFSGIPLLNVFLTFALCLCHSVLVVCPYGLTPIMMMTFKIIVGTILKVLIIIIAARQLQMLKMCR